MILGFSGSRDGMTEMQRIVLQNMLHLWQPKEFHHGMCIGADEQAHAFAFALKIPIIGHPPEDRRLIMTFKKEEFREIETAFPYLTRNRYIVSVCDTLIATPKDVHHARVGGTWYTIKFAVAKRNKKVFVIAPNGDVQTGEQL